MRTIDKLSDIIEKTQRLLNDPRQGQAKWSNDLKIRAEEFKNLAIELRLQTKKTGDINLDPKLLSTKIDSFEKLVLAEEFGIPEWQKAVRRNLVENVNLFANMGIISLKN